MMGPLWWRKPENRLLKCSERTSNTCDPAETDGCCAVIPCEYCLELEVYGEPVKYGLASFNDTHWAGTVDGFPVVMYWERGYVSGECEFVVEFDGEEVYRKSCYEGQSCRNSSDSATVEVAYEEGLLTWTRVESLPLPHVSDPDTGCKTWFCGECECTCECLCVSIEGYYGTCRGEACHAGYECEGAVWKGIIPCGDLHEYDVTVTLVRDEYDGSCAVVGQLNSNTYSEVEVIDLEGNPSIVRVLTSTEEDELDQQSIAGCKDIDISWTLYDGTVISVKCKVCDCDQEPTCATCCEGNHPTSDLVLSVVALDADPRCACWDGFSMTLTYKGFVTNALGECEPSWEGIAATPCPDGIESVIARYTCGAPNRFEFNRYVAGVEGTAYWDRDLELLSESCDPFEVCYQTIDDGQGLQACGDASVDDQEAHLKFCLTP